MKTSEPSADRLRALGELVAERLGIDLPPEKSKDLIRGLRGVARNLGFDDLKTCTESLLSPEWNDEQFRALAKHITIGETYFFRHENDFKALTQHIVPLIVQERSGKRGFLNIWSVASSSGEEPYSIAMTLDDNCPGLKEWDTSIVATDINPVVIEKARAGLYSSWSFRNTNSRYKSKYFKKQDSGKYQIADSIRAQVSFNRLNLATHGHRSILPHSGMDVVFCRNVLMYFTSEVRQRVFELIHKTLADGGWLVMTASEAALVPSSLFQSRVFDGTYFYQKKSAQTQCAPISTLQEADTHKGQSSTRSAPKTSRRTEKLHSGHSQPERADGGDLVERAEHLFAKNRLREAASILEQLEGNSAPETSAASAARVFFLLAKVNADRGRCKKALHWCSAGQESNKLNPEFHFLHGTVLQELGRSADSIKAMKRALFLDHCYLPAYFVLGNLYLVTGEKRLAERQFRNALSLLQQRDDEEILSQVDGVTSGRLKSLIEGMLEGAVAS